MRRERRPVAVVEEACCAEGPAEPDGLWGIALLRVALELKRPGPRDLSTVVAAVVRKMGLPEEPFRRYVEEQLTVDNGPGT